MKWGKAVKGIDPFELVVWLVVLVWLLGLMVVTLR